jgi:hypothetical protein
MRPPIRELAIISVVALLSGCCTVSTNRSALEYRVQKVEYGLQVDPYTALQDYLNTMSKDGWRLVQFVESDNKFRVVMSRAKK